MHETWVPPQSTDMALNGVRRIGVTVGLALLLGCSAPNLALTLPDVRQSTGHTCGAAALQAVLAYYGVEAREDRLAAELASTPENGTTPENIARVAQGHGIQARLRFGLTLVDLANSVRAGAPVLVMIQAWGNLGHTPYADDWEDGHYVVVVAVETATIVVEDPSLLGSRGVLSHADFAARWHDRSSERSYVHAAVVFDGNRPNAPMPYMPVE